jgi:RNA polymerase sigma factor (TIGR02999 family)
MDSGPAHQVTVLLEMARQGDSRATDELLPLVYEELRRMARARLSAEQAGLTLQPTALVHEAYMRLVGDGDVSWNSRGHFFGAAAQAMRRILVERARHHGRLKRGGDRARVELTDQAMTDEPDPDTMLVIDEALERLTSYDKLKAQIVMLRFFTGLTVEQTGAALGLTPGVVKAEWAYARAWMHKEMLKAPRGRGAAG